MSEFEYDLPRQVGTAVDTGTCSLCGDEVPCITTAYGSLVPECNCGANALPEDPAPVAPEVPPTEPVVDTPTDETPSNDENEGEGS